MMVGIVIEVRVPSSFGDDGRITMREKGKRTQAKYWRRMMKEWSEKCITHENLCVCVCVMVVCLKGEGRTSRKGKEDECVIFVLIVC